MEEQTGSNICINLWADLAAAGSAFHKSGACCHVSEQMGIGMVADGVIDDGLV